MSTTHTSTKSFLSLHWNQVKFDLPLWNQVIMGHHIKEQASFHAHTKNKWISASIQVASQFLPPAQEPNHLHPSTEIKSNSIPHSEVKSVLITMKRTSQYFHAHTKTSIFRPAHKNKVNFYFRTKNMSNSFLTKKTSQFVSPTQNQHIFHPNSEVK